MLKTVYKFLLYLSIGLAMSHAQAATNSKVRLAASLGARAIKPAASAVKKHFFKITSAIAFVGYVKYQHSKYERRIAPLEKKLKEARACRNNAVKESLDIAAKQGSGGNLTCPQGIVDIVNGYAEEDTLDDCKAAAARAKQMTFKEFARGILQNPFDRNNLTEGEFVLVTLPVICVGAFMGSPMAPCCYALEFGIRKALGKIPYHFLSTPGELRLVNNWQDAKSFIKHDLKDDLKGIAAFAVASTALSAAILTKKWLRAREQAAARQP